MESRLRHKFALDVFGDVRWGWDLFGVCFSLFLLDDLRKGLLGSHKERGRNITLQTTFITFMSEDAGLPQHM